MKVPPLELCPTDKVRIVALLKHSKSPNCGINGGAFSSGCGTILVQVMELYSSISGTNIVPFMELYSSISGTNIVPVLEV